MTAWQFSDYRFPWASVHPSGSLPVSAIRDADWRISPPEIRTRSGETLFLAPEAKHALEEFCTVNGIPLVRRFDVWGNLLEPFLDTSFSAAHQAATDSLLHGVGLTQESIDSIRVRLWPLMRSYNFDSMLWEWADLSLFDLLKALNGELVDPALPPKLGDPFEVYRWAMEIADLGGAI